MLLRYAACDDHNMTTTVTAIALSGVGGGGRCPVSVSGVCFPVSGGRWPMAGVRCPVAGGRWPVAGIRCPVAGVRWPVAGVWWPVAGWKAAEKVYRDICSYTPIPPDMSLYNSLGGSFWLAKAQT